jgi:hypothetical protein
VLRAPGSSPEGLIAATGTIPGSIDNIDELPAEQRMQALETAVTRVMESIEQDASEAEQSQLSTLTHHLLFAFAGKTEKETSGIVLKALNPSIETIDQMLRMKDIFDETEKAMFVFMWDKLHEQISMATHAKKAAVKHHYHQKFMQTGNPDAADTCAFFCNRYFTFEQDVLLANTARLSEIRNAAETAVYATLETQRRKSERAYHTTLRLKHRLDVRKFQNLRTASPNVARKKSDIGRKVGFFSQLQRDRKSLEPDPVALQQRAEQALKRTVEEHPELAEEEKIPFVQLKEETLPELSDNGFQNRKENVMEQLAASSLELIMLEQTSAEEAIKSGLQRMGEYAPFAVARLLSDDEKQDSFFFFLKHLSAADRQVCAAQVHTYIMACDGTPSQLMVYRKLKLELFSEEQNIMLHTSAVSQEIKAAAAFTLQMRDPLVTFSRIVDMPIAMLEELYCNLIIALESKNKRMSAEQRKEIIGIAELLLESEKGQSILCLAHYLHLLEYMPKDQRDSSYELRRSKELIFTIVTLESMEQRDIAFGDQDMSNFGYSGALNEMLASIMRKK